MNTRDYLEYLAEIAAANPPVARARVASALVLGGRIISVGYNRRKTHPLQAKFGKNSDSIYLHAEIDALAGGLRHLSLLDLTRATLYTTRVKWADENRSQLVWGLVRPCAGCERAVRHYGLRQVYFTTEVGWEGLDF